MAARRDPELLAWLYLFVKIVSKTKGVVGLLRKALLVVGRGGNVLPRALRFNRLIGP